MVGGKDETPQRIANRSAAGGVNTRFFPLDIQEDQAVELRNMDTSTPGQRVKRQGSTLCATGITYGPILALSEYKPDTGNTELLAVSPGSSAGDNHHLWKWDGTGTVFSHVGALTGYTGYTRDVNIVVGYDIPASGSKVAVIGTELTHSTDKLYYNGSAITTCMWGAAQPRGQMLGYGLSRAIATAPNAGSNTLYYSDVASFTVTGWTTAQAVIFGGGTSQSIVAAEMFRSQFLIVFMSDRIEQLNINDVNAAAASNISTTGVVGINSWSRQVLHTSIGCGSRRSVKSVGQDIFFADQFGNIRSLGRTINDTGQGVLARPVSDPIDSYIQRLNPSHIDKITCEAYDRWLVVGLPLDTNDQASHIFLLDVARMSETGIPVWDGPWTDLKPREFAVAALQGATAAADKQPTLYLGGHETASGVVRRMFRGNADDGAAIIYQETTKRMQVSMDLDHTPYRIEEYLVGTGAATMHVEANIDATGFEHVGYVDLLGDTPLLPQDLPFTLGGTGVVRHNHTLEDLSKDRVSDIQFRFTVTTTEQVKMLGYSYFFHPEPWDRTPD